MCAKRYRNWHNRKYAHHFHVAALGVYVFVIIFSLIFNLVPNNQTQNALAANGSSTQTSFNGLDGTYTNTTPANSGSDVALNPVLSNAGGSGWNYKRPITITNGSGGSLTDYQVQVQPFSDSTFINNTGLVGSWHLNGGTSGSVANGNTAGFEDLSGNGNVGTASNVNGTGMAWSSGKFAGATTFDGVDDYVSVGTGSSMQITGGNVSIEAWIKTTSASGAIFEKLNPNSPWAGYGLALSGGKLSFWYGNNVSWDSSTATVNDGNWHHVAVTFDSVNSRFYIDGNLDRTVAKTGTVALSSTAPAYIGMEFSPVAGKPFNGQIDEVKVYSRVLTGPASTCTLNSANETCQRYGTSGVPKVRGDYADLRFTNAVTGVEYPYWQETDGKYWVKINGSLPSGTNTNFLNMYYGNPSAVTSSSTATTFPLNYNAATGFSGVQGTNSWYYQQFNGSTYTNMTYNSGSTYWYGTDVNSGIGNNWMHSHPTVTYEPARKWVSGGSYSLIVRGNVSKGNLACGNGVITKILKNSTQLYSQTIAYNNGAGYDYSLYPSVVNGDALYFRLNSNGEYSCDTTNFNPTILARQYLVTEPVISAPGSEATAYNTAGSFVTNAIAPAGVYDWGVLTYTKTTPGTSGLTVDLLNGSTNALITANITTGTNLNLSGISYPAVKIRVNYTTSSIGEVPTLSDWALAYSYDTTAPTVPSGLSGAALNSSSITLSWSASNDADSGVLGYEVQRAPDVASVPGTWADVTSGGCALSTTSVSVLNSCEDNFNLTAGTKYWYRVRGRDLANNFSGYAALSNSASTKSVTAPTDLTLGTPTSSSVTLTWVASGDTDLSGYKIERATDVGGLPSGWIQVYDSAGAGTSWTNSGLSPNTKYYYRVRAYTPGGNSTYSGETGTLIDSGFESGVDGALLSTPWAPSTDLASKEYDSAYSKIGNYSGKIRGWSASPAYKAMTESESAGMTSDGAEVRFWMYFDSTNELRRVYDNIASGGTFGAYLLSFDASGNIATTTSKVGDPNGYTTGSAVTVGTQSVGWTQYRIVHDFTNQRFILSTRTTVAGEWLNLKRSGASNDYIPMRGSGIVTQTGGIAFSVYQDVDLWLDEVRFSSTVISDAPSTTTLPSAPTGLSTQSNSQTSITLSWTGSVGGAASYNIYKDGGITPYASVNHPVTTYTDSSGVLANSPHTYIVKANTLLGGIGLDNSSVESDPNPSSTRYSLALNSSVSADKLANSWSNTTGIVFSNVSTFGVGGLTKYKYVWDQSATHSWTGAEPDEWNASTLTQSLVDGNNYLHVRGYNGDNVVSDSLDLGPFNYDASVPSGSIAINSTEYVNTSSVSLNLNAADTGSGVYQMRFSNSGAPTEWTAWESYDTDRYPGLPGASWDLSNATYGGTATQGLKTVYVEFIDSANNAIQKSDTIYWDGVSPTNATAATSAKGSGAWDNNPTPTFSWSGATDAAPSSLIMGYWVYFGTNESAEPKVGTDSGNLAYIDNGNDNLYLASAYTPSSTLNSGSTYYLKLRTVDNALNDASATYTEGVNKFVYRFDNTAPTAPEYIDVTPPGITTVDSFDFNWPAAIDNPGGTNSGICSYDYMRENGTDTWTTNGSSLSKNNIQRYRSGANRFNVRANDCAGNVSLTVKATYYFSDPAALVPQNLQVDTSASAGGTINNFKFTWDGVAGATRYYVASNGNPTEASTSFAIASLPIDTTIAIGDGTAHLKVLASGNVELGPYASATQTGPNDFRVVAVDGGGNANWATPATGSYSVNTVLPAAPDSLTITDASNRSASMYALTVMWPVVSTPTPDFDGYVVEKSENGTVFSAVATVKTNIYSEAGLTEGQRYYFRVKSRDNTGNISSGYASGDRVPTGKYTSAPAITADPKIEVRAASVTITWNTARAANSIVKYGPTDAYGMEMSNATDYVFNHEVVIQGLAPGVTYHYKVASIDKDYDYAASSAFSNDFTFTTLTAPGISNVETTEVRLYSAIITWKTTSSATSKILYGTTDKYGASYTDNSGSQTTTHTVKLDNLKDATQYHYKIQGIDVDGNILQSDDYIFKTLTFPKLSNLKIVQVPNTPTSTVRVEFDSNVPTSSLVTFTGTRGKDVAKYDLETIHALMVPGLADNTNYSISVRGRDRYGNEANSIGTTYKTDFDTRPPYITDITVETSILGYGVDAKGQLVISWTTDEPGTSQVEYGTGVGGDEYSSKTQEDGTLTENHVVIISDLKPSSPYHFRVVSKDSSGNTGKSGDNSVLTEEASSSVIDLIIKSLQASIGWIFNGFGGGR